MTKTVHTCGESKTLGDAVKTMLDKNIGILPVVNESEKLVGVITESHFVGNEKSVPHSFRDLRSLFGETFHLKKIEDVYKSVRNKKISEVMTRDPLSVSPDASLINVVELMNLKNIKRLPVVDGDSIVGVITRRDLIRAFNIVNS